MADFVQWTKRHITGDEKGEAQPSIDHLIKAFGQPGAKEAGGVFEHGVKRVGESGKTTTTITDYVRKPVVVVELEKRGEDLSRHDRSSRSRHACACSRHSGSTRPASAQSSSGSRRNRAGT